MLLDVMNKLSTEIITFYRNKPTSILNSVVALHNNERKLICQIANQLITR